MPEHGFQEALTRLLRIELGPPGRVSRAGVVWWCTDASYFADKAPGARIARGCIPGVPDVFLLWRGLAHLVELKALDGSLSDEQRLVASAIIASGGRVAVCARIEEVLDAIDAWSVPRSRRTRVAA